MTGLHKSTVHEGTSGYPAPTPTHLRPRSVPNPLTARAPLKDLPAPLPAVALCALPPTLGSRKRKLWGSYAKKRPAWEADQAGAGRGIVAPAPPGPRTHGSGRSGRGNPGPGGSKGQLGEPENDPRPPRPCRAQYRPGDGWTDGWTDGRTDRRTRRGPPGGAGAQTPPRPPGSRRGSPLGSGRGFIIRKWADRRDSSCGHWAGPLQLRPGPASWQERVRSGAPDRCSPICQILRPRDDPPAEDPRALGDPSGGRGPSWPDPPRAVRPGQRPASEIQLRSRRGDAGSPALGPQRGRWGVEAGLSGVPPARGHRGGAAARMAPGGLAWPPLAAGGPACTSRFPSDS